MSGTPYELDARLTSFVDLDYVDRHLQWNPHPRKREYARSCLEDTISGVSNQTLDIEIDRSLVWAKRRAEYSGARLSQYAVGRSILEAERPEQFADSSQFWDSRAEFYSFEAIKARDAVCDPPRHPSSPRYIYPQTQKTDLDRAKCHANNVGLLIRKLPCGKALLAARDDDTCIKDLAYWQNEQRVLQAFHEVLFQKVHLRLAKHEAEVEARDLSSYERGRAILEAEDHRGVESTPTYWNSKRIYYQEQCRMLHDQFWEHWKRDVLWKDDIHLSLHNFWNAKRESASPAEGDERPAKARRLFIEDCLPMMQQAEAQGSPSRVATQRETSLLTSPKKRSRDIRRLRGRTAGNIKDSSMKKPYEIAAFYSQREVAASPPQSFYPSPPYSSSSDSEKQQGGQLSRPIDKQEPEVGASLTSQPPLPDVDMLPVSSRASTSRLRRLGRLKFGAAPQGGRYGELVRKRRQLHDQVAQSSPNSNGALLRSSQEAGGNGDSVIPPSIPLETATQPMTNQRRWSRTQNESQSQKHRKLKDEARRLQQQLGELAQKLEQHQHTLNKANHQPQGVSTSTSLRQPSPKLLSSESQKTMASLKSQTAKNRRTRKESVRRRQREEGKA